LAMVRGSDLQKDRPTALFAMKVPDRSLTAYLDLPLIGNVVCFPRLKPQEIRCPVRCPIAIAVLL
jgi:hypothetical protein